MEGLNPHKFFSGRKCSNIPELSVIVTSGFNVNATDPGGNSCLHFTCEASLALSVKDLLNCDANVCITNNGSQTVLHKIGAGQRDCPDLYLLLMEKGAILNAVGRDGAGKTSLTKALTLQEFNPNELSARGLIFDPKCQIIVNEASDWTTPLTSEHCRGMSNKNVVAIMPDRLNKPDIKEQCYQSRERKTRRRKPGG
jgi:hypothetical protein